MVNPFELSEKFPPEQTLREKIYSSLFIGGCFIVLALALLGVCYLVTLLK